MSVWKDNPPPYDWTKIRSRKKRHSWMIAIGMTGWGMVFAGSYFQWSFLIVPGGILFLILVLHGFIYQFSSCPRCRDPFFYKSSSWVPYKARTRKCLHCELPLWSEDGKEP